MDDIPMQVLRLRNEEIDIRCKPQAQRSAEETSRLDAITIEIATITASFHPRPPARA